VRYYIWEDLKPLQHWQVDTKDILDSRTLPPDVYRHLKSRKLPRYQYTAIDPKTRIKFIAYAYQNNRTNALAFIRLFTSWLRCFGISDTLYIQTDWGGEYGGSSLRTWQALQRKFFSPRNLVLLKIRKRRWQDNAYVERTHRTDDEEFYIPRLKESQTLEEFFSLAWGYISHFNTKRPHFGKFMNGEPPLSLLRKFLPHIPDTFAYLPPVILDLVSSDKLFIKEQLQQEYLHIRGVHDVFNTYSEMDEVKTPRYTELRRRRATPNTV